MADFIDVFRRLRKLSEDEKDDLDSIKWQTTPQQRRIITGLVKEKKVKITHESVSIGGLIDSVSIPTIGSLKDDSATKEFVREINKDMDNKVKATMFKEFAKVIHEKSSSIIAPNIVGFGDVKKAVALQLFSPEHIHILLLGDPGTGKTDILSAAKELAPISSMGLGSGTSGVGLAVTVKGKEIKKGLLPLANDGLCAIDELNLMKEDSRASLYNAMEKGFVSYDKGGHSYKFDAKISVLATANPKGDKFTGTTVPQLKKQLPFDAALLSRFHLTFLIRKHTTKEFKEISRALLNKKKIKLTKKESEFLKEYVKQAHAIEDVKIPKQFEQEIVDFIADIKESEHKYLVEISPRLVVGFSRLTKASARMALRDIVEQQDVDLVKSLVKNSLKI